QSSTERCRFRIRDKGSEELRRPHDTASASLPALCCHLTHRRDLSSSNKLKGGIRLTPVTPTGCGLILRKRRVKPPLWQTAPGTRSRCGRSPRLPRRIPLHLGGTGVNRIPPLSSFALIPVVEQAELAF